MKFILNQKGRLGLLGLIVFAIVSLTSEAFAHDRRTPPRPSQSSLDQALRLSQRIVDDVRYGDLRGALVNLRETQRILVEHPRDQELDQAYRTLSDLEDRLNDPRLRPEHKVRFTEDSVDRTQHLIRSSRYYRGGGGGGAPYPPRDQVHLGTTGQFDKAVYSREILRVDRYQRAFRGLAFRARGNNLLIDSIQVISRHGTSHSIRGTSLRDGAGLSIQFHSGPEAIEEIIIMATTDNWVGSRGRLEIFGMR